MSNAPKSSARGNDVDVDVDVDIVRPFAGQHIKDFYADANVFVSGGSGYLGKVIVEKLLRTCHGVRRVYVLMRPKRGRSAAERVSQMLAEADVFRVLRDTQPALLAKVHCLEGDMAEERLGLSAADQRLFRAEVNVVVHSAATVRFNEPMSVALNLNVLGTRRLLDLCAECADMRVGACACVCIRWLNCAIDFSLSASPFAF